MGVLVLNPVSITTDGSIYDSLAYSEDMKRRAEKFLEFERDNFFWGTLRVDITKQKTDRSS